VGHRRRRLRAARGGRRRGHVLAGDQELLRKWSRHRKRFHVRFEGGRRAESLASAVESAWHARHGGSPAPERSDPGPIDGGHLEHTLETLDGLAERWHALDVGGSLTVEWPRRPVAGRVTRRG
jgi:hypothetical protein